MSTEALTHITAAPERDPEPEPHLSMSPKALAALVLALVTGLSGLGWLNRTGDHVTTREFDLFKEQQKERDVHLEEKLDQLVDAVNQARPPAPSPPSPRRSRK